MSRCAGLWMTLTAAAVIVLGCADDSDRPGAAASSSAGTGGDRAQKPDPHARALATSASHSCALRKAGLYCWGANDTGQLGDGSTASATSPVKAALDATDVVEVAVHTGRSCVRRRSGAVACWGANASGQLGDGTRDDSLEPVEVALEDAAQLALSENTSCALRDDGSVYCWGGSPDGSSEEGSLEPKPVDGVTGALALHSGPMSSYCARGAGWTRCWRLDAGAWTAPIELPDLAAASGIALASAQEVCGIVSGGEVVCSAVDGGSSARLSGSRGTIQLAGGLLTVCGGDIVGAWYCWNILSPMVLQAIGAPRSELTRGPFDQLVTAGFRYCGLGPSGDVQCVERNTPSPQWMPVADLPD
jgi:hypothetical protein